VNEVIYPLEGHSTHNNTWIFERKMLTHRKVSFFFVYDNYQGQLQLPAVTFEIFIASLPI